jgi:hypothetical protein
MHRPLCMSFKFLGGACHSTDTAHKNSRLWHVLLLFPQNFASMIWRTVYSLSDWSSIIPLYPISLRLRSRKTLVMTISSMQLFIFFIVKLVSRTNHLIILSYLVRIHECFYTDISNTLMQEFFGPEMMLLCRSPYLVLKFKFSLKIEKVKINLYSYLTKLRHNVMN